MAQPAVLESRLLEVLHALAYTPDIARTELYSYP